MGNCMRPPRMQRVEEGGGADNIKNVHNKIKMAEQIEEEEVLEKDENGRLKKSSGLKVKIVLTKEELDWLMCQLKVEDGRSKLEDLLKEIERAREGKTIAKPYWKPSLESIVEIPAEDIDHTETLL